MCLISVCCLLLDVFFRLPEFNCFCLSCSVVCSFYVVFVLLFCWFAVRVFFCVWCVRVLFVVCCVLFLSFVALLFSVALLRNCVFCV